MTTRRFDFQRQCVARTTGTVLNIGANDDPAGLKETFGTRVINCDDRVYDVVLKKPLVIDWVFDCSKRWPFDNDEAELVVLGDILEHLLPAQQIVCLAEAWRVAPSLCITVPNDARFLTVPNPDIADASFHIAVVDEARLRWMLQATGWQSAQWETVDYDFVPEGYFVRATRKPKRSLTPHV